VPPAELVEKVRQAIAPSVIAALTIKETLKRAAAVAELKKKTLEQLAIGASEEEAWAFSSAFTASLKFHMRRMILDRNIRSDGRSPEEIRPIDGQVGVFPRTHGSAIFTRGETQALVLTTLGTKSDQQRIEGLEEEEKRKRFMLHYNFPAFCTGETAPIRGPKRREIGHGHLAERSLAPVLPPEDVFPYTVRVVADILSSNGSSSMAAVCGGSLSLMDAGVPLTDAVAGIALGLLLQDGKAVILTDILGSEDALGDMDFKVAGTKDGVTGLQMDIKVGGISEEIMKQALARARTARLHVLEIMNRIQSRPRPEISLYAPKILSLQIDPDKIGLVIGPKGKNIKALEKTGSGVTIDIEDDGQIMVSSSDIEAARRVKAAIEAMVAEVEVGTVYTGKVVSIKAFGAFVEIIPGKEGLVHISELSEERVGKVEDVVKEGEEVRVKVINIDNLGRIKLSRKQALPEGQQGKKTDRPPPRPR
ncbi:MAG: polyribonucleotide nucleotidyltransferase, partial [Candidatus Aureabacteria bacterium]|nr:polyribonucleotide nucleotidyltransferase [Candidatus Auribacterota bacterium]